MVAYGGKGLRLHKVQALFEGIVDYNLSTEAENINASGTAKQSVYHIFLPMKPEG